MRYFRELLLTLLALAVTSSVAADIQTPSESFRVLSWNISGDAFVTEQAAFQSLLRWGDPDIVLLDEVKPSANPDKLVQVLAALRPGDEDAWNINIGASGGRQRGVIASRSPLELLPEFSSKVPYPDEARRQVSARMTPKERALSVRSMDAGIPVSGAVILAGGRRLLVVITDLTCCGDGPDSWEELRRRIEIREIRRRLRHVLERITVDGIIIAGDFNLVGSTFPMTLLAGPYPLPHSGLIPAEIYHADGTTTWTWDGRGTPFYSNTLDYQLYGPRGLTMRSGLILDSEDLSAEELNQLEIERDASIRTSNHRPLVVEYTWN